MRRRETKEARRLCAKLGIRWVACARRRINYYSGGWANLPSPLPRMATPMMALLSVTLPTTNNIIFITAMAE
ncbi:hypothetical protein BDW74DRAFT_50781 [Aspergillus multicolor]|uniref:uncharacterized protein n=1 Tax=Aspergillus multicolor TaxID=41759 RepID=UPI003CCE3CD8